MATFGKFVCIVDLRLTSAVHSYTPESETVDLHIRLGHLWNGVSPVSCTIPRNQLTRLSGGDGHMGDNPGALDKKQKQQHLLTKIRRKKYVTIHGRQHQAWDDYKEEKLTTTELLRIISHINALGPSTAVHHMLDDDES
ncbi:hypothetical protein DPMN_014682 [Dreissena polymorpha]|uniref:Uncharacterized protein n=1 Tax=Dreissena polymorpha TaxID=45954 RepID=A0A9D4S5G3_DREPO|nr:hypothetical protein DPMN_014682 [Dreissena polymorpha]